jgi:glycosyltransferase involved in cell wall biosynthesis
VARAYDDVDRVPAGPRADGRARPGVAAARRARILHVMDKLSVDGSRIAGPARLMGYYVPRRPAHRCDVLLCGLRREDGAERELAACGVDVVCLGRSKYDLRALADLERLVRDWRPSLLHLHGYASWTFGRLVARAHGLPVVLQEHFVDDRVPAVQRVADWLLRHRQEAAIAVSPPVRDFMINRRYITDTKVEIIWNAVPVEDLRRRAQQADTAGLRRAAGLPPGAPLVGIVGRLAEEKGHEYFLDIAARVAGSRPDVRFVIVGEGPRRRAIEAHAARLGLRQRVHFAGFQEDVVPWLAALDVSMLTSRREGFPAVPLESLAAGAPVVMTDLDVFRDVYTDEREVLKIPPRDPAAAARKVLRLLGDPALRARLLENAQSLLEACSVEAILPRYSRVYTRLLAQKERPA